MNVGSLFSGVGGLDLGLHLAGWNHVFFAESDGYRRDVLAARWPGVPVYDDVRGVHGGQRGGVGGHSADAESGEQRRTGRQQTDLLCGGFPCQDLSVAGRRRGLAGERSGLFFEFARIADALRPRWLLVENVPGLLSSNGGRDFGVVLGTLADLGYGLAWRIVDSRFFGVPQRRRRVFIVGALADGDPRAAADRAGQVLAVGTRCPWHPATRGDARENVAVASLSGLGSGGPDDNDGQANRVIAASSVTGYAISETPTLDKGAEDGPRRNQDAPIIFAAPLTKGSATGDGVNQPERRQEDDVNLVTAFHQTQDPISEENATPALGRTTIGMGVSYALNAKKGYRDGDADTTYAVNGTSVRRLTPTECERLQGFPDGWTQLGGTPDSRRYAALGDAVTVNVARWIGERMIAA